ncbi:MAG: paraquat-inducible protein A [Nonlabens sp.]|uniref:paraquat-inducible protein A n=1 Tax=Nonlabens sp. TaxID=1888209 RepID=UPI003EF97AD6
MKIKKQLSSIVLLLLFISISLTSFKIHDLESSNRILKADLTELSDIKYGLFNVDKWKEKIATIIGKKIDQLELTEANREENKLKIINLLSKIIDDFEKNYKEENKKNSSFGFSLKNFGVKIFSIFEELKKNIPEIADTILNFLEEKENRDNIKAYIISKLDNYTNETFQSIDYTIYDNILNKYSCDTGISCVLKIENKTHELKSKLSLYYYLIIFLFCTTLITILIIRFKSNLDIILYSLIAIVFLLLGITSPMIDIDARIKFMEFNLLGENISFENQVLYYKSKSVLEMAKLLLLQEEVKIFFVGLLVLLFSVLFPVFKIISTLLVLFFNKLKNNTIINFMAFKSGKWSMADVMVVAIFMSYIGFSGIISSQLAQLEQISSRISILTTNDSDIQSGFFFFTGFVILGILISQMSLLKIESKND